MLTVAICFVPLVAVMFPASASAAAASAGKVKLANQASAAAGFFFNVRTPAALIAAGALKDAFVLSGTSPGLFSNLLSMCCLEVEVGRRQLRRDRMDMT